MEKFSNNIVVALIEETDFTIKDLVELLHDVFKERLDQGMNFLPAVITEEQLRKRTENSIIVVAYDVNTHLMVASGTLDVHSAKVGHKYGKISNMAVRKNMQGYGLASYIYKYRERESIKNGCSYILSNTAVNAISSVKYHLKNGFKIVGLISHANTNYYSYLFRKQLKHPSLYDIDLYVNIRYNLSEFITRACYREDGSIKPLGYLFTSHRIIKKQIKRLLH